MDWLKDKKNQPYVAAGAAMVIVIVGIVFFMMNRGGSSSSEAVPPEMQAGAPPAPLPQSPAAGGTVGHGPARAGCLLPACQGR